MIDTKLNKFLKPTLNHVEIPTKLCPKCHAVTPRMIIPPEDYAVKSLIKLFKI